MAVYTKINQREINIINENFNIEKIINFKGIKQGIENTNYILKIKSKKYILTIFEKRVDARDLPFFMQLMSDLSRFKVKCPNPVKSKNGKFIFKIKNNYRTRLLLRSKNNLFVQKHIAKILKKINLSKKIKLIVDVDPLNFS